MKTDSDILNLSTLRDMGLYVHIPFCKQKCMYCDFPAIKIYKIITKPMYML